MVSRYAVIENGVVVNAIIASNPIDGVTMVQSATAVPGDLYANGQFSRPAPVTTVPAVVTMRQARLALLGAGLLTTVNASITAMPGASGDAARIDWEFASEVRRTATLVAMLGPVLGLTSAQLDGLFIAASEL